jgi:hypothetical protein
MQQRIGHEDQTPMFSNGFGTPHAILVEAQMPLTVLIKRFRRPALPIQADDFGGAPVHPVGHQHDMAAAQRLSFKAHDDPHLAQAWNTECQREAPIRLLAHRDGAIGRGGDQRHELLDRDMGTGQLHGPAVDIPQLKAGGFQQTVRFEQADPGFPPSDQDPHQVFRQVPGVEDHHTKRHLAPDGLFHQFNRQLDFRAKLCMPCPKVGILEQDGIDLRMQAIPLFGLGRDLHVGKVLGHRGVPLGQLLIATIEAQVHGEAHGTTDVQAGHRIMGQGIGALAMVVVTVHIVKQTPHMLTQRIIQDQQGLAPATPMGLGLLQHKVDTAAIHGLLPPGSLRKKTGEIGFISAVEDAPGNIGHALVGQDDEPGQIMLKMPKLTRVLKHVTEDRSVLGDHRSRLKNRQFHHAPPDLGQGPQPDARVTWGARQAKSQLSSYDHDVSGAGAALVENARQVMSVTAFTMPEPDTDLDQFIRSFGHDYQAAHKAVKTLVAQRQWYPRHYQAVADEIFAARQQRESRPKCRDFEINAQVAEILLADLHDRGRFYHDEVRAYVFLEGEKKLIAIDPDDTACTLMLADYGINRSEVLHRYLIEALRVEALKRGTQTAIHRLAYYNPATFTLYLFNQKNQIYRISPERSDLVDNGTDGVLFLSRANAQPFEVTEPDDTCSWFDRAIVSPINFAADRLTPAEQRLMFILWFYSLFFESLMRTKPILAFIGPKGSGKSITNRKVGKLLLGENFDVMPLTDDPKDFDAAVTHSAFVAIDNVDTKCQWLNDRLATVATGGSIKKREYYTTNTLVEIPAHCFLAITSRTPQFRRDDVADRLLILKVERYETFRSENTLLDEVLQNRNQIMSEVVHHLQQVVQALRTGHDADDAGAFRMADFAAFAMKVARHAGVEAQVTAIFDKLTAEQSAFTLEGDPIFELLCAWTSQNSGREVTNKVLCAELAELAEKGKVAFPYQGKHRAFAQHMFQLRSNLKEFFLITARPAGGNTTLYTFTYKQGIDEP